MRRLTCIATALLLCNVMPAAQATVARAKAPLAPVEKPVAEIRTALAQNGPRVTRGQIAVCANLAAIRALNARAAGSDYPTQSRILDVSFVLCLAGSASAD